MQSDYGLLGSILKTKRRIFVSYHHDSDQGYYNEFSRFFADEYEAIQDNSLDRLIDSTNTDYVIRRIREHHITGTSCTIVLCGPKTSLRKYVDWEIKATLDKDHSLIGVLLPNNLPDQQGNHYVPARLNDNIKTGYALFINWEDLNQGPTHLKTLIEAANNKSTALIDNSRALRKRNG
jgi:hypothetical protein